MSSMFDAYMERAVAQPAQVVVTLSTGFTFVFKATREFTEIQRIEAEATRCMKDRLKGNLFAAWEKHRLSDETPNEFALAIGRAVHLAERHLGFMDGEEFIAEPWDAGKFLALKTTDGYGFMALMEGLSSVVSVTYSADNLAGAVLEKKAD